jgi:hypothetical protein
MNPIHIIVAVWGKEYIDTYLNVSLPSQLAPDNLKSLIDHKNIVYKIFTVKNDEEYIKNHPIYQKLEAHVNTRIICINNVEEKSKFAGLNVKFYNLTKLHNRAIKEADIDNAAIIFLFPDYVLADNTFATLFKIHQMGYRAILTLTLRIKKETAISYLMGKYYSEQGRCLTVSARELTHVALQYLHPIEKSYFWGDGLSSFPIHAYWPVKDEGLLARCFYLHPLLIHPAIRGESSMITIDADYIDRSCPNLRDIYVIRDSDELTCLELTSENVKDENAEANPYFKPNAKNFAKWAVWHCNPVYSSLLHHWLFQVPIKIGTQHSVWAWKKAEIASRKTAKLVQLFSLMLRKHACLVDAIRFNRSTKQKNRGLAPFLVNIELTRTHVGINWGEIGSDEHGREWRWTGLDGGASLILNLIPSCSYMLITEIQKVDDDALDKIHVSINGNSAKDQKIVLQNGIYYHKCILPKSLLKNQNEFNKIEYELKSGDETGRIGVSRVFCQPLRWARINTAEKVLFSPVYKILKKEKLTRKISLWY